jgi:hypothetical protein
MDINNNNIDNIDHEISSKIDEYVRNSILASEINSQKYGDFNSNVGINSDNYDNNNDNNKDVNHNKHDNDHDNSNYNDNNYNEKI